jgi:arginyl-tRNA synthetase
MDVFSVFHHRVAKALGALYPGLDPAILDRMVVEPPRDRAHGDLSTNAAMIAAKPLGLNPRQIATGLAEVLGRDADVASVEVAGPGFINFVLTDALWQRVLGEILAAGAEYGKPDIGHGEKLNVEYVSTNPTGPMHVGHTRGAVYGDALASLMEFAGFDVTREYYVNDAGGQIDVLARSAFLRYRESLGHEIGEIPEGFYPGDYLRPVGDRLCEEFGEKLAQLDEAEWMPLVRPVVLAEMMDLIRADLAKLGIRHDVFFSEQTLHGPDGDIAKTLAWLRARGLVYQGRLPPPKGREPTDYDDREQTLFRASDFGDDTDRALIKSDGTYTYFAADIAYHRNKFLRGFLHQAIVLGADHGGYVKRLGAALKAVSDGKAEIDVKICQIVTLLRDGVPVKMSKRSGNIITLADVVDEVGSDAVRFIQIYRRNDAPLEFDFAKVVAQTRDNPVFYVQYAHARACSIFRTARTELPDLDFTDAALQKADLSPLSSPPDHELLRVLGTFARTVEGAALSREPHRVAFYLFEVASAFHSMWAKGNHDAGLRFVNPDDVKLSVARLALVRGVRQILVNGLAILGVSAPEELS